MGKDKNWVVYKEIKERVSMKMVLGRYGLLDDLKPSGQNFTSCCPIHKGSNPRQFSVSFERNIFNCFGNCKAGGNVIDFVARMEKVSVHEAALLLKNWFLPESSEAPPAAPAREKNRQLIRKEKQAPTEKPVENDAVKSVNPPLNFQLKNLILDHPFFSERGIVEETVKHFGLGFCQKGMMANRIAISIHNDHDELVAYCGRSVTPEQAQEEGKYKLPPNFKKLEVVYNLNRQAPDEKSLILVESFLSVFHLHQHGFRNAVAIMGSVLGETQEELLVNFLGPSGRILLAFDADEDGQKCAADCLNRLGRRLFVKTLDMAGYGRKPHQLEAEALRQLFSF